ncbi:MAG: hypothetical protein N2449_04890 [Bacteroidales bacterium]|nr:hypothetical protein [Bacteroidales bacterium]
MRWLNKIWQILIWVLLIGTLGLTLGFTEKQRTSIICNAIVVRILDSCQNHFITAKDILKLIEEKKYQIKKMPIANIPLNELESKIINLPHVYNAQVYTTIDGQLMIDIWQRTPMLRIINYNYESYYVDSEGVLFPLSDNYTARVLIASGNINEPYALYCNKKAIDAEQQENIKRETLLDDIFILGQYIHSDSLWNAMIEQIYINENKEFELIPKVGDIIIEMGDTSDMDNKFMKLKAFYQQIVPKINLEEYLKINLKYKNQIVCTKKNTSYEQ